MGGLGDFANEKGNFIRLAENGSFTGIYQGFKLITNKWGGRGVEYTFELKVEGEMKKKVFNSSSASLASSMDSVGIGQEVTITKKGSGTETRYTVTGAKQEDGSNTAPEAPSDNKPDVPF